MRRLVVVIALATGLAAPAGAASYPPDARPRSRLFTSTEHGVIVTKLTASVRRAGHRLDAKVAVRVRNTTRRRLRRVLRVGRCTRGPIGAPACPPTRRFGVDVPGHVERRAAYEVRLRLPPRRLDSIVVTLAAPGVDASRELAADAVLTLRGTAWRSPKREYGLSFLAPDVARSVVFDLADFTPARADMFLKWEGRAAPDGAATACRAAPLPRARRSRSPPRPIARAACCCRGAFSTRPISTRTGRTRSR